MFNQLYLSLNFLFIQQLGVEDLSFGSEALL